MFQSLILVSALLWATVSDFKTKEIPNVVHVVLLVGAALHIFLEDLPVKEALLGIAAGVGLTFAFAFAGCMGWGDVKLFGALGAWFGTYSILDVFFLSFVIGAVPGVYLWIKYRNRKMEVPFGPYIAAAALIVWFTPVKIVSSYFVCYF